VEDAMKLLVFLAVWKRPQITEICFMGLSRLRKVPGYDINVLAVISEEEMIPLCEKYNVKWVMHENLPLGRKKNFGVNEALKLDWEYLIEIGSDDLLKNEVLQAYKWDAPVLGLMDFALIDTQTLRSKRLKTKIPKYGAGRAIKRNVVESCKLWEDNRIKGMDNSSCRQLSRAGFMQNGVNSEKPLLVELKSEVNIWSYRANTGSPYTFDQAVEGLSEDEIKSIKSLVYAAA
jgi:hypothetical protein